MVLDAAKNVVAEVFDVVSHGGPTASVIVSGIFKNSTIFILRVLLMPRTSKSRSVHSFMDAKSVLSSVTKN